MRALFAFIAGMALCASAAELVLRMLPVSTATLTGYYVHPDVLSYPARHKWQVSTGWDLRNPQRLSSNNWGFADDTDFEPDAAAVVLIGDSYVEASMLESQDRPGAQLRRLLSGRAAVYAMGSPGTALLDYAQRMALAAERLHARNFVLLLESGDVRQAICGSGNIHSHCLAPGDLASRVERQPAAGRLKEILRESALARYFVSQLKFSFKGLWRAIWTRKTPEAANAGQTMFERSDAPKPAVGESARRLVDRVVNRFFELAGAAAQARMVFVLDGRRDGPSAEPTAADLERRYLMQRLRERGASVVDLEPVYAEHVRAGGRSLAVGPYDGHLNRLGVQLAMRSAAGALESCGKGGKGASAAWQGRVF